MTEPFGHGLWEVYTRNRFTGQPLISFEHDYTAGFDWSFGTTDSFVNLDRDRHKSIPSGIVEWRDELVFVRDDEEHWAGPITAVSDKEGENLSIGARDATVWAAEKRSWKSDLDVTLDAARIVAKAFEEGEIGDPTGIQETFVDDVGEVLNRTARAGESIGRTIDEYSILSPFTLVGSSLFVGYVEFDTGLHLGRDSWLDPTDAPTVLSDGESYTTRTNIQLRDDSVVSWPETDFAYDGRSEGGLVESFFQLDVTPEEARAMARAFTLRSQHGLFVGGSSGLLSPNFPLNLHQLRPGLLFGIDTEELGSLLKTGDVTQLSRVSVSITDGREDGVSATFGPQFVGERFDAP